MSDPNLLVRIENLKKKIIQYESLPEGPKKEQAWEELAYQQGQLAKDEALQWIIQNKET